ncbi:MAG: hypothetical protein Q9192_000823 [Flavoplaca navasiana]
MAPSKGQKRPAAQADIDAEDGPRRTRSKSTEEASHFKRRTRSSAQSLSPTSARNQPSSKTPPSAKKNFVKKGTARPVKKNAKSNMTTSSSRNTKPAAKPASRRESFARVSISDDGNHKGGVVSNEDNEEENGDGPSYWLMKAEPDSRIEKGKDVKFSIDDLKEASEPEAWDARNNMRSMMQGDMAFFYHSNCKSPGIVGTMEIVREHSVDGRQSSQCAGTFISSRVCAESAFDNEHPYYDEKSTRDKPKWCVVHVEFRRKFQDPVTLKELQRYAKPGGILENMQTLKMARLSVSRVSKKEWEFIHTLTDADEQGAPPTTNGTNS